MAALNEPNNHIEKPINPCPRCCKEMEPGFLLTPHAIFRSVRWSPHYMVDPHHIEGEKLASWTDDAGSIKFAGFRCKECRLLVLRY